MEYILTSLEMFAGIGENLINYTFNVNFIRLGLISSLTCFMQMASYEMNKVMRRLTLATIIFLPLTLLTGYFGMNFQRMWSLEGHSDVVCVTSPSFSSPRVMYLYSRLTDIHNTLS